MPAQTGPETIAALFGAMLLLAMVPSVSVLTVSARAAAHGFSHGLMTALGIVAADTLFILVAVYGLALLAEWMGERFVFIEYLGGVYLIWLGCMLWRNRPGARTGREEGDASLFASFTIGLLITLGDQKAILFYLGFFPAFFDLTRFSLLDTAAIVAIAALSILLAKLVYAWLADRAGRMLREGRTGEWLNRVAAVVMVGTGVFLIVRG